MSNAICHEISEPAGVGPHPPTPASFRFNRQKAREKEAHRREVALHAKLDELLIASRRARDEIAEIEELEEEEEIEWLKRASGVPPLRPGLRKAAR